MAGDDKCPGCGAAAMPGHITCGQLGCDERAAQVIRDQTGARALPNMRLGEATKAALTGLFAAEGRTLLQLLFAWRAQGSLTRWSTGPSKGLALFIDFLQREYPTGCKAAATKELDFQPADEAPSSCEYEDCEDEPQVVLKGSHLCPYHALLNLLIPAGPMVVQQALQDAHPRWQVNVIAGATDG